MEFLKFLPFFVAAFIENLPVLLADEDKASVDENHVEDRYVVVWGLRAQHCIGARVLVKKTNS